jgi:hypothetical protein
MGFKKSTFKSRVGKGALNGICQDLASVVQELDELVWESVAFLQGGAETDAGELQLVVEDILLLEAAKSGAIASLYMLDKKFAKGYVKDTKDGRAVLMKIISEQIGAIYGED